MLTFLSVKCTVLYCTVLYYTVQCCTVQYRTVQYCTVLYCTAVGKLVCIFIRLYGRTDGRTEMGPFLSVESTTQCYRDCSRGPSGPKNLGILDYLNI